MPKFSKKSLDKLSTCHPDLQLLFKEVIKNVDCSILEGIRTKATQEEYVRTGKSKTMNSKHLPQDDGVSWAVDCIAYPIDWNNWKRNYMFAGYVRGVAESLGMKIRCGADWNSNMDPTDQTFHDLPHFELLTPRSAPIAKKQHLPDIPSEDEMDATLADLERNLDID